MSSRLQTPVFKKDKNYEVYSSQLQLWRECTDLAKEKQGIFIYLSLPDDDETKIKESALDELSASELKKEMVLINKVWWQCLVPTSATRFASDVGYRMAKM